MNLEECGISKEDLMDIVTDKIVSIFCRSWEDGSGWRDGVETSVAEAMSKKVDEMFGEEIEPSVNKIIEEMVLQRTSRWGEVKGEPQTMREYISTRITGWLHDHIDYNGKVVTAQYEKKNNPTRIKKMIDEHLGYRIEIAIKDAMTAAQSGLVDILNEHVKGHIQDIAKKFTVTVKGTR